MYIVTMVVDMKTLDLIACCRPLDAEALADDEAEATARIFKALGDPARVKIVNRLARADEPVCGCEFQPDLGLSQATVSRSAATRQPKQLLVYTFSSVQTGTLQVSDTAYGNVDIDAVGAFKTP